MTDHPGRHRKDEPPGVELSGTTSDKLRDHIKRTGDNSSWQHESERDASESPHQRR